MITKDSSIAWSEDHHASRMAEVRLLCFVNPSLQCCYKENIRRSSCISCGERCVEFTFVKTLCSPNEDFGRMNKWWNAEFYALQTKILEGWTKGEMRVFEVILKGVITRFGYEPLKCQSKISISSFFHLPKSSFGRHKFRLTFQWFVAQVEYSHPLRGPRKCGSHLLFSIPNHRLGGMDLYAPQTIILKIGTNDLFSKYFSRAWALCLGDESFKSTSKRDTKSFVPIFKIFVWGAWFCAGWLFYNIARMGLQNTTNTRDALMIVCLMFSL